MDAVRNRLKRLRWGRRNRFCGGRIFLVGFDPGNVWIILQLSQYARRDNGSETIQRMLIDMFGYHPMLSRHIGWDRAKI